MSDPATPPDPLDRKALVKAERHELSAEVMRERAIKSAKRTLGPHFDAVLLLLTWRNDDDVTEHQAAYIGNNHATDNLAKTYVESGCNFPEDEEEEEWKDSADDDDDVTA